MSLSDPFECISDFFLIALLKIDEKMKKINKGYNVDPPPPLSLLPPLPQAVKVKDNARNAKGEIRCFILPFVGGASLYVQSAATEKRLFNHSFDRLAFIVGVEV